MRLSTVFRRVAMAGSVLVLTTGMAVGIGSSPAWAQEAVTRPNVLMVVWDTSRADHMSVYGYERETTPNLERIAQNAAVFDQAVPGGYWTAPSVASMFTGLMGHNHRVDFDVGDTWSMEIPAKVQTLAETMKSAGYRTATVTNARMLYDNESFARGFDEWVWKGEPKVVPTVLENIDREGDQPWFILAYFRGAHAPYTPEPEHDLWSGGAGGDEINVRGCGKNEYPEGWKCFADLNRGDEVLTDEEWARVVALYDAELHQHDALLGELWKGLESRGVADSTLFVFTSDHGEALNEHEDIRAWHTYPYEDTQSVPLIVRLPGVLPTGRYKQPVRNFDLFPTITRIAGATLANPVNGEDLLDATAANAPDRPSVGFTHAGHGRNWYRDGQYKLIFCRESKNPRYLQVYDLKADPGETVNLAETNPELVTELKSRMSNFVEATTLDLESGGELTTEQMELLEALGYVE